MTSLALADRDLAVAIGRRIGVLYDVVEDFDDRLSDAADFVAEHGVLADLFDEPHLGEAQRAAPEGSPWHVIGHWSEVRGDGLQYPPGDFRGHTLNCDPCAFLEGVLGIGSRLDLAGCADCGRGAAGHHIGPTYKWDQDGPQVFDWSNPAAWCLEPWSPLGPVVLPAFTLGATQISDAIRVRWVASLQDGRYAIASRTWYLYQYGHAPQQASGRELHEAEPGTVVVARDDYWVLCEDPDRPEQTKQVSVTFEVVVESDNPLAEDLTALADRHPPLLGEWAGVMPEDVAQFEWE